MTLNQLNSMSNISDLLKARCLLYKTLTLAKIPTQSGNYLMLMPYQVRLTFPVCSLRESLRRTTDTRA